MSDIFIGLSKDSCDDTYDSSLAKREADRKYEDRINIIISSKINEYKKMGRQKKLR